MSHPLAAVSGFDYNLLDKELGLSPVEKELFDTTYRAYKGDYYQDGKHLLLPKITVDGAGVSGVPFYKERYVSRNVIKEGVGRVSAAFFGKGPNWQYVVDGERIDLKSLKSQAKNIADQESAKARRDAVAKKTAQNPNIIQPEPVQPPPLSAPGEEKDLADRKKEVEQKLTDNEFLDEMDRLLGEFWTTESLAKIAQRVIEARLVMRRGGAHIFVLGKYRDEISLDDPSTNASPVAIGTGESSPDKPIGAKKAPRIKPQDGIAKALKTIAVEFVEPDQSRLLTDDGEKFSIIKYKKRKDWATNDTENFIEFSFVDDAGKTFIGLLRENEASKGLPSAGSEGLSEGLELDENTTFYEMSGDEYVTQQVFQNNQLLNLSLTNAGFCLVDNGFGEMVLTNVDLEMMEVPDKETGGVKKIPKRVKRGGGVINNFVGVSKVNLETANEEITTPGVHFREPSALTPFVEGKDLSYAGCLEELCQKYALITGDAASSGEARIQAMADFYLCVRGYKAEVDKFGSWLMTVLLRLAAKIAGKEEQFKNVSVVFDSKIKIGNLSADEQRIVMEKMEKGIISKETARVLLDVEDPRLEEDLIEKEAEKKALNAPMPVPLPAPINQPPVVGGRQPGQ